MFSLESPPRYHGYKAGIGLLEDSLLSPRALTPKAGALRSAYRGEQASTPPYTAVHPRNLRDFEGELESKMPVSSFPEPDVVPPPSLLDDMMSLLQRLSRLVDPFRNVNVLVRTPEY